MATIDLTSPLRTLVVDDDHDTADTLGRLIEISGGEVRVVYDGVAAVDAAVDFEPDVGLIDLQIPQLDGFRLAKRLRDLPRLHDMMLVAVTGFADTAHRTLAKEAGFDEYMVKPFSLRRLKDILRIAQVTRRASYEVRAASEGSRQQSEDLRAESKSAVHQAHALKDRTSGLIQAQRRKDLEHRLATVRLESLVSLLAAHADCRRTVDGADCWCAACIQRAVHSVLAGEALDDDVVLRLLAGLRDLEELQ